MTTFTKFLGLFGVILLAFKSTNNAIGGLEENEVERNEYGIITEYEFDQNSGFFVDEQGFQIDAKFYYKKWLGDPNDSDLDGWGYDEEIVNLSNAVEIAEKTNWAKVPMGLVNEISNAEYVETYGGVDVWWDYGGYYWFLYNHTALQ